MAQEPWFRLEGALVDELKECHRADLPVPAVDGYRDLVLLQRGGQGSVYLALQEKDGRRVALKVFHEHAFESPIVRRRFEREIVLVSRLDHPNVVRLQRFGRTSAGRPFLAMEFVQGRRFDVAAEGATVDAILGLARQVCDALDHAHRRGVIHRDLKPGNVLVDGQGSVRLLDFGLAKPARRIRSEDGWELSATGQFLGTLSWASPEQLRGHPDEVDVRTDVYSFGVLLFHALTGCMPYPVDGSVADVVYAIENTAPEPLRQSRPEASADVETIILRCLAKDPARRYGSMAELSRDLGHTLAGEPIEARRDGLGYILRTLISKHRLAALGIAAASVALLALSIVSTRSSVRAKEAERVALLAVEKQRAEVEKVAAVNEFLLGSFFGQGVAPDQRGALRLRDVLSDAAARIETDPNVGDRSGVRADLHVAFAFWFSAFPDRLQEAIAHADRALQLYGEVPDAAQTQVAWAYEVRGGVAIQEGRHRDARGDLREALLSYRAAGADELNIARVLSALASCAFATDELDDLEPMLLECQEIALRRLGADHPQTVNVAQALTYLRERQAGD